MKVDLVAAYFQTDWSHFVKFSWLGATHVLCRDTTQPGLCCVFWVDTTQPKIPGRDPRHNTDTMCCVLGQDTSSRHMYRAILEDTTFPNNILDFSQKRPIFTKNHGHFSQKAWILTKNHGHLPYDFSPKRLILTKNQKFRQVTLIFGTLKY